MRRKLYILMIVGVCFTVAASAGSYSYLRAMERELEAAKEKLEQFSQVVTLPVLVGDVAQGEKINEDDVTFEQVSMSHLPQDVIRTLEDAVPQDGGPLIALTDLEAGHFLLRAQLTTPTELGSANFLLPIGGRAYSLRPDNSDALINSLAPGDPVDIFWRSNDAEELNETRLLATSLQVARPYTKSDEPSNTAAGAAESRGSDGRPSELSAKENIVLVGPAEEIALLIQTEGRGQHIVVPANQTADAADYRVSISDEDIMARRASAPPSAGTEQMEQELDANSLANNNNGSDNPDDTVDAIQSLVEAPSKCTLNIIRSAARSVVEVPC